METFPNRFGRDAGDAPVPPPPVPKLGGPGITPLDLPMNEINGGSSSAMFKHFIGIVWNVPAPDKTRIEAEGKWSSLPAPLGFKSELEMKVLVQFAATSQWSSMCTHRISS